MAYWHTGGLLLFAAALARNSAAMPFQAHSIRVSSVEIRGLNFFFDAGQWHQQHICHGLTRIKHGLFQ